LLATLRKHRWIGWAMVVYSLSVAVATVYGRYHFAVDAVAGIGVSLVALVVVRVHRDKPAD
jgi:membrane-associated phospholipid phosphatase